MWSYEPIFMHEYNRSWRDVHFTKTCAAYKSISLYLASIRSKILRYVGLCKIIKFLDLHCQKTCMCQLHFVDAYAVVLNSNEGFVLEVII